MISQEAILLTTPIKSLIFNAKVIYCRASQPRLFKLTAFGPQPRSNFMARLKKSSAVLETARRRLAGLKSFKTPPDFGPNLTVPGYEAKANSVAAKLEAYNQALAMSDQLQNEFKAEEAELNDLNRRYLSAGEAHFGPDSSEYEMLGGTRKSERKRPTRKGGPGGGSTPPKS
jgi:hypothetical protein